MKKAGPSGPAFILLPRNYFFSSFFSSAGAAAGASAGAGAAASVFGASAGAGTGAGAGAGAGASGTGAGAGAGFSPQALKPNANRAARRRERFILVSTFLKLLTPKITFGTGRPNDSGRWCPAVDTIIAKVGNQGTARSTYSLQTQLYHYPFFSYRPLTLAGTAAAEASQISAKRSSSCCAPRTSWEPCAARRWA